MKNGIHHVNLVKIKDMKSKNKKNKRKVRKSYHKVGIGKMKIKTWFVYFFLMLAQSIRSCSAIRT